MNNVRNAIVTVATMVLMIPFATDTAMPEAPSTLSNPPPSTAFLTRWTRSYLSASRPITPRPLVTSST